DFLAHVDDRVRTEILDPLDEQVAGLENWVRGLLGHLPLRALRAEITKLVHEAAKAIEDADLDGPAQAVRGKLHEAQDAVANVDLGSVIADALHEIETVVNSALDVIVAALEAIGQAVQAVAGEAESLVHEA